MSGTIPQEVLSEFESLVTVELTTTRGLKKELKPVLERVRAGQVDVSDSGRLSRIAESVEALLDSTNRNTSPFYVRQIHAMVRFFVSIEDPTGVCRRAGLEVLEALTNHTATTVHKQWLGVKPA